MIRFSCERCQTKVKVPEGFAGKRVKCPGCGEAVRVPAPVAAEAGGVPDLSLLEALEPTADPIGSTRPRKLRTVLLGCGACSKTIKVPENQLGTDFSCPKCKAGLRVPRLDLPPVTGKGNIDLKHLTLEPLLGDAAAGSLAGRTALHATGSLAGMSGTGPTVGGASTSQEQMQQLRALNDARAEGSITDEEFRRKKAEVYATAGNQAALARAATSRGPAGMPQTLTLGRQRAGLIPGPLKLLAVLALLGAGGFAAWQSYVQHHWRDWLALVTGEPRTTQTGDAASDTDPLASADHADTAADAGTAGPAPVTDGDGNPATATAAADDGNAPAAPVIDTATVWVHPGGRLADFALAPAGFREQTPDAIPEDVLLSPLAPAPPPPEADPATVTDWPGVYYPDSDYDHPFAAFSSLVKVIDENGTYFGVGAGPPAEGLDDPAYRRFRDRARQALANVAPPRFIALELAPVNDRAFPVNGLPLHRLIARSPLGQNPRIELHLYTGVQDGACVVYWFHGGPGRFRDFDRAVGKATLQLPE